MSLDIEKEKQGLIAKLEALERVGLDYKALQTKLANFDVVAAIQQSIQADAEKITKFAKRHGIEFVIDVDSLVATVKLPEDPNKQSVDANSTVLPFKIDTEQTIYDDRYNSWRYIDGQWTDEWESSWASSNC